jgi:heme exporter protein A
VKADSAAGVALEVRALTCVRNEVVLFRDLAFSAGAGEMVHVSGANGSGKTSLLRILCGLGHAESGEVHWRGREIGKDRAAFAVDVRHVGHANGIKLDLTAGENLGFGARVRGTRPACAAGEALKTVGLAGCEHVIARHLSAGQRRRLALARLVQSPGHLWILDEPFTSLDADGRAMAMQLIAGHLRRGGVAVVAAHDLPPSEITARKVHLS